MKFYDHKQLLFRLVLPPKYRESHLCDLQLKHFLGDHVPGPSQVSSPGFNLHRMLCFIGHLWKLLLRTLIRYRDHKDQETVPWRLHCTLTKHC